MGVIQYVNRPGPIPLDPVVDMLKSEASGLALDFVTGKAYVRGGGKDQLPRDINGFLNYASPSTKYVMDTQGVLVPGTTLRCDHDAQGNPLGLLIEDQRTNYLQQSDDVFSSPWVRALGNGVLEPVIDSRFGVMAKFTSTEESNLENIYNTPTSLPSPTEHVCYSMVMRILPGNSHTLQFRDRSSGGIGSTINLETGEITAYNTVNSNPVTVGRIDLGDGYYRYWWSCLAADLASFNLRHVSNSIGEQFIFGKCQIENGTFPTSYIKTEGSQVTRAADLVTLATAMFPWSTEHGTLIFGVDTADGLGRYTILSTQVGGVGFGYSLEGQDRVRMSGNGYSGQAYHGFVDGGPISLDLGISFGVDNIILARDGVAHTYPSSNNSLATVATELKFGRNYTDSFQLNGHFRNLVYFPRKLSEAELIARTAL